MREAVSDSFQEVSGGMHGEVRNMIANAVSAPVEVPLSEVEEGRAVRIARVCGGRGFQSRLMGLGLRRGMELEVLKNPGRGPCLVAVRHSRVALGRGMAAKVLVS